MDEPVILKWRDDISIASSQWRLRVIRSNGSYFGEVLRHDPNERLILNIEGRLYERDDFRLRRLIKLISKSVGREQTEVVEGWTGLFGLGSASRPFVLLRYKPGGELHSIAAKHFLEAAEMIRPYILESQQQETKKRCRYELSC